MPSPSLCAAGRAVRSGPPHSPIRRPVYDFAGGGQPARHRIIRRVKGALVIVGATGMVGGYALRYALEHPGVGRMTSIGRRTLGISHPKLREVLHRDFSDCSALAEALSGQDAALYCLGTYTGSVPDA